MTRLTVGLGDPAPDAGSGGGTPLRSHHRTLGTAGPAAALRRSCRLRTLRGRQPLSDRGTSSTSSTPWSARLSPAIRLAAVGPSAAASLQGVEQAVVNGPIKLVFRRQRPSPLDDHPHDLRAPHTSSFPSGHASAGGLRRHAAEPATSATGPVVRAGGGDRLEPGARGRAPPERRRRGRGRSASHSPALAAAAWPPPTGQVPAPDSTRQPGVPRRCERGWPECGEKATPSA